MTFTYHIGLHTIDMKTEKCLACGRDATELLEIEERAKQRATG